MTESPSADAATGIDRDAAAARFGGGTIQQNIDRAVASGNVVAQEDGRLAVPLPTRSWFLHVKHALDMDCYFLNNFLFEQVYQRTAVPAGCQACFKVKVAPNNFRGLIAVLGILEAMPYHSKCGIDFFNYYSRDVYAGYLYFTGLPAAREGWKQMRERIDAHPHLGPATSLTIKRGCSNYEAHCGPSNQWTFAEGLLELEAELKASFEPTAVAPFDYRALRAKKMAEWLQIAHNLGDDSYLDFTGGKPLRKPTYTYPPVEPPSTP